MHKDKIFDLLTHCYLCGEKLLDSEDHGNEWIFSNIDGLNAPVCWGCDAKMDEYKQDAMAEGGVEDGDF